MLGFTSLPKLLASSHPKPPQISKGGVIRLPRLRRQRALLTLTRASSGNGGGMHGGGGGDGDDGFFSNDPEFNPRDFSLFAVLSFISNKPATKLPFLTIAEVQDEEEEEEMEEEYIKPAPKPKAESLSYGRSASLLLLLLLLSGGVFLWRRSRNHNPHEEEEDDLDALVQRSRELPLEPQEAGAEDAAQETHQELRSPSPPPDFVKDLNDQDALFGTERDVKIESHSGGVESLVTSDKTPAQREAPKAVEPAAEDTAPIPVIAPPVIETLNTTTKDPYYDDLAYKDALFSDQGTTTKANPDSGDRLIAVTLMPSRENSEAVTMEFYYTESHAKKDLESEMSERSRMSPTSHIDEGSTQSAATYFSGADSLTSIKERGNAEEFNFDKPPVKCPIFEEDLGPPIKPQGIDFTKPPEWETNGKWNAGRPDDKTNTMRYLLSNADLLAQALKHMESQPENSDTSLMPQIPDQPKDGTSKKKRRRNKKKKPTERLQ